MTVTFDCQDGESGISSCTDPVTVSSEGADQQVTGDAVDNAGNTASTTVSLSLDKTAPSVSLSGPLTGRRGQTLTVTAAATDNLSAVEVVSAVDGVDVATLTDAPFETTVSIPPDAVVGSFVQVTATATDLAGNAASATPLSVEVLGGGFLSGEVYDDTRGLPLAGVSVTVNGQPTTSGPLGSFGVFTNDSVVEVVASPTGFTTVERVATMDSIAGTVVVVRKKAIRASDWAGDVAELVCSGESIVSVVRSVRVRVVATVEVGLSADVRRTSAARRRRASSG